MMVLKLALVGVGMIVGVGGLMLLSLLAYAVQMRARLKRYGIT